MIKIQIIGNYLDRLRYPLRRAGIVTEGFLESGNPLGFVASSSNLEPQVIPDKIRNIDNQITQLTLKKSLSNYLAHDEMDFHEAALTLEYGKSVRIKNSSKYVALSNNVLAYPLFLLGGELFSDTWPRNGLSDFLREKHAVDIVKKKQFVEQAKRAFDSYISVILNEYDSDHIILIRSSPSLWCCQGLDLLSLGLEAIELRQLINQADQYFIEITKCQVANSFLSTLPESKIESALPGAVYSTHACDVLAREIESIIARVENRQLVPSSEKKPTLFQAVAQRFKGERLLDAQEGIAQYLFAKLHESEQGPPTLSKEDKRFLLDQTSMGSIDIDDIIALYELCKNNVEPELMRSLAGKLLANPNCYPVVNATKQYQENKLFLSSYRYFDHSKMVEDKARGVFLRLSPRLVLKISIKDEDAFSLVEFDTGAAIDPYVLAKGEQSCDIRQAEKVCSNLRFYIERARSGNGGRPIEISYSSEEDYYVSMFTLNYCELIESEAFVFEGVRGDMEPPDIKTDLSFLFKENVKIVKIRSGLADQLSYYYLSKCLELEGGLVYYDDLHAHSANASHNGYELDKVVKQDLSSRLFSNIFSNKLQSHFDKREADVSDLLVEAGLSNLLCIASHPPHFRTFKKGTRMLFDVRKDEQYENIRSLVKGFGAVPTYYYCIVRPDFLMTQYDLQLSDLLKDISFEDAANKRIMQDINEHFSIGVHIRRGDYASIDGGTDIDYYKSVLEEIIHSELPKGMRIFVFSDDIDWCKANESALGLIQEESIAVTYVGHNSGDDSYKDMLLLSSCNVIVGQQGGFARTAFLISKVCSSFVISNQGIMELHRAIGKGSKYDI